MQFQPRPTFRRLFGSTTVSCWAINSVGKIGRATLTVTVSRPHF